MGEEFLNSLLLHRNEAEKPRPLEIQGSPDDPTPPTCPNSEWRTAFSLGRPLMTASNHKSLLQKGVSGFLPYRIFETKLHKIINRLSLYSVMETTGLPVRIIGQGKLEAMKPETKDSWNIMHEDDLVFLGTLPQAFSHSELNLFLYVFHSFTIKKQEESLSKL